MFKPLVKCTNNKSIYIYREKNVFDIDIFSYLQVAFEMFSNTMSTQRNSPRSTQIYICRNVSNLRPSKI